MQVCFTKKNLDFFTRSKKNVAHYLGPTRPNPPETRLDPTLPEPTNPKVAAVGSGPNKLLFGFFRVGWNWPEPDRTRPKLTPTRHNSLKNEIFKLMEVEVIEVWFTRIFFTLSEVQVPEANCVNLWKFKFRKCKHFATRNSSSGRMMNRKKKITLAEVQVLDANLSFMDFQISEE